jgi:hypothetical protein
MRIILAALVLALFSASSAFAQGCCTQTNGGGQTPNGTAVGVPATNNGGNAPPGQQPSPPGQDK